LTPRPEWRDHPAVPTAIRTLARRVTALLPQAVLRRIADYRFGYSDRGRLFAYREEQLHNSCIVVIDERIRLKTTPELLPALRFHFVENGQSRDEMGAFIDAAAALPPDALLYDVGAHCGIFSLVHCAMSPRHRAVLFEPSDSLARDAAALIALNGFQDRAAVRVCGIGERKEVRRIIEDDLGFARDAAENQAAHAVEFTTLDEEWQRTRLAPAILKIDVEGAEAEVIRGASAILRDAPPLIFIELHTDVLEARGESFNGLLHGLSSANYHFRDPNGKSLSAASVARSLRAIIRLVAEQTS
jgi:FkbM family methyltransferase